jgi:signal peptidase I
MKMIQIAEYEITIILSHTKIVGGKRGDNIKDRYTKIYKINKLLHINKEYNHRTSFHTVTCIISNLAQSQYTCAALAGEIMIPASVKEPKSIYLSLI